MFEQLNPNNAPRGAQAVAFSLAAPVYRHTGNLLGGYGGIWVGTTRGGTSCPRNWILPTLLVPYDFWEHVNFYHHPFKIAVLQYFYPDDVSSEWTFLTIPWIQSFLYSFGLILAAWYTRSKRAPLTTTSK